MIRNAAGKIMWVGRATVFLLGVAVILALVFGAASTVEAHTGNKGFFHLGHRNVSKAISTLVKRGAGPALNLKVDSGPPLAVNSSEKVAGLNADQLDGVDSAAFGRLAKASTSSPVTLTQATQTVASVKITPGSPNGFLKADAHVLLYPSDLAGCPCDFYVSLYSPETGQYFNSWYAIETMYPDTKASDIAITGAVPVSTAGEKTVEVLVHRASGTGNVTARADLVATYFPFDGAGNSTTAASKNMAAGSDAPSPQPDVLGATPR